MEHRPGFSTGTKSILVVEDNPRDVDLLIEAFQENGIDDDLHIAKNGNECLTYLREGTPRNPDLIILDLNLPGKNGREILAEIKHDARFQTIPVLVLSMSQAENDIRACYELNANCFITKPLDFEQFICAVRAIREFWLATAALPQSGDTEH